jgi:hypothetical protein
MIVGFTGTRGSLSTFCVSRLLELINKLDIQTFHHGDCVGADATMHEMVGDRCDKVIHPPNKDVHRAYCNGYILPELSYMDRNKNIVDSSELMIATPPSMEEITRSGTWSTVRYARKRNKPLIIVFPDGTCEYERFSVKSDPIFDL